LTQQPATLVKVKVKLSLCILNRATRYEDILGEQRYSSTHSFTSALDGGEWSASRPGRFTPRARARGTHWKEGGVGPRAVLDAVVKKKIPSPLRESKNPDRPARSPPLYRLGCHGSLTSFIPECIYLRTVCYYSLLTNERSVTALMAVFVRGE
jgi:hypothetical protein